MWERQKTEYDYGRFFKEWVDKDVASWIRRDRNRPSVIMWSIGNEIYDTHANERGQELTIQSIHGEIMEGICQLTSCPERISKDEIPVRKLEIISPEGTNLNKDRKSMSVHVNIHPHNAAYREVEWRVTNEAGINSNLAKIEADGAGVLITAIGDGTVYLRCATKNGGIRYNYIPI